jgi:hypothetical protein
MKSLFKIYGKKFVKPATFSLAECAKKGAEVENMRSWEAEKISTSQLPNLFLFSFFVPGEPPLK